MVKTPVDFYHHDIAIINLFITGKDEEKRIIREADVLYSQGQPDNLLDYLRRYSNVSSAEVNWRLAR